MDKPTFRRDLDGFPPLITIVLSTDDKTSGFEITNMRPESRNTVELKVLEVAGRKGPINCDCVFEYFPRPRADLLPSRIVCLSTRFIQPSLKHLPLVVVL